MNALKSTKIHLMFYFNLWSLLSINIAQLKIRFSLEMLNKCNANY